LQRNPRRGIGFRKGAEAKIQQANSAVDGNNSTRAARTKRILISTPRERTVGALLRAQELQNVEWIAACGTIDGGAHGGIYGASQLFASNGRDRLFAQQSRAPAAARTAKSARPCDRGSAGRSVTMSEAAIPSTWTIAKEMS
jgi:hypothetical protein